MPLPPVPDLLTEVAGGWAAGLLGASVRGTVLLLAALAVDRALRSRPAAARHLVWVAALTGLLALPFLSGVLPPVEVPGVPSAPAALGGAGGPQAPDAAGGAGLVPGELPSGSPSAATGGAGSVGAAAASSRGRRGGTSPIVALAALWLLGAFFVLGRGAAARLRVWWMARTAARVRDARWIRLRDRLARRLGLRRDVELLRGSASAVPMTWGLFRPRVLLPPEAGGWSEPCRRNVLLHELAHVRRGDYAMRLLGRAAVALYWFHPLAWLALRRMRRAQEEACDDHVLRAGARPSEYARQLLRLARRLRALRSGASPAGSGERPSEFYRRLRSMLRSDRPLGRVSRTRRAAGAAAAGALVIALAVAAPAVETSEEAPAPSPAPRLATALGGGGAAPASSAADPPDAVPVAPRPEGGGEDADRESAGMTAAPRRPGGERSEPGAARDENPAEGREGGAPEAAVGGGGRSGSGPGPPSARGLPKAGGLPPLAEAVLDTRPDIALPISGEPRDGTSRSAAPPDSGAPRDASLCRERCTVEGTLRRLRRRPDAAARLDLLRRLARSSSGRAGAVLMDVSQRAARAEDRRLAVRALATVGGEVGDRYLFQVARANPWASVRAAAVDELGRSSGDEIVAWLVRLTYTEVTPAVQKFTVSVLARLDRPGAGTGLLQIARSHPADGVRREAVRWLRRTGRERALARLMGSA